MLADWQRRYPDCEPVGHRLRAAFPERWVRFHSLPAAKRYPDGEDEFAELLNRHNCVLGALAQCGGPVVLVTTGYSESARPVRSYPALPDLDPLAIPWRTVAMHTINGKFGDPAYWHLFASRREWQPGVFDPVVRWVAEDAVANVLIVAEDCRWVLHPYDGGMDVIAESSAHRDRLKVRFPAWLSARLDGL